MSKCYIFIVANLTFLLWFSPGHTQQLKLASNSVLDYQYPVAGAGNAVDQDQGQSLSVALNKLADHYQVSISYDPALLKEKLVKKALSLEQNLDANLTELLAPHQLNYRKLEEGYYVIQPRDDISRVIRLAPEEQRAKKPMLNSVVLPAKNLLRIVKKQVEQTISGQVVDLSTNEPLPGVNILVKGTSIGTVTDIDGNYRLTVADEVTTLVFSSIGFETIEEEISGRAEINISLAPDIQSLSEVVVVGYGTTQKKDLTGAVAEVSSETIENRQAVQLSDALQGSVAGVTVTRDGGGSGEGSSIRVRGVTSLNVNDPLVIVDGIQGLTLDDINPNDVESVTVLKDAASQAIYGARAAAGVVLVTTKRGTEGQLRIEYDYEFGSNYPTELPEYVNAKTYREIATEYSTNDGGGETFDPEITEQYDELHAQDPDLYPDTDWQDAILSDVPTARHRHNLALTVGSQNVNTRASMSYVTEDGMYANNDFQRFTFRVNNGLTLGSIIEANIDLYYKRTNTTDPARQIQSAAENPIALSRRYPGIFSAIRTDGEWGEGKDGENPLAQTIEGGSRTQTLNQLNGIIGVTIKPTSSLSLRLNFSPTFDFDRYDRFFTPPDIPRLGSTTEFWPQSVSSLEKRQTNVTTLTSQAIVSYDKTIGDHQLNLLGGYEEVNTDWDRISTTSRDLGIELDALAFGDPLLTQNEQNTSENNIRSFFGRIGYNYKGKYLLQSNFRADGSSRFAPDERWGFFPSLSLGWVVSEESFDLPTFISFLKVRGSYGEVGNEQIGNRRIEGDEFFNFYPYQGLFELVNTVFYDGNSFVSGIGVTQDFLADQFLVWETTRTIDAGIDLGFLDDRITVVVDAYRKTTDDIIITQDLPNYLGYPNNTKTNVGSIEVEGLDFEVGYRNQIGNLRYAVNANASVLRSEILDVGGIETFLVNRGTQIHTEGAAFGEWFGYQTDGLYQTQEQIDEYGITNPTRPGDVRIIDQLTVDTDNDGVPDERDNVINGQDRVPLGTSLPTFTYGGNITLNYRNLDFSLVLNGVGNHNQRYNDVQVQPLTQAFGNIPTYVAEESWRPGNTEAQNQAANFPRFSGASRLNYAVSDFWLYNAAYLRIQNITLGYSLPTSLSQRASLQKVRVYVALRNFATLRGGDLLEGWDPEVDFTGHPIMKSVLFGINVKF
ncbi:SusC/RagA family TonB-linked outer membrane protein [Tunicatimonas pelagia]|uniref:SusC/RagA family TonB-linked outer membrane protein n=1 Tax=Tunicatimonas pelagia TaxID=931531 RepID=UPI0026667561|nr:TonB-dependent receptor [Tunicatimonas pelagia]WKN45430.1 TonB-dependent receptor [Tunicatimonas pelagia]